MEEKRFGRLRVIPGGNHSKFPSCRSLVVEDDIRTIIDPGIRKAGIVELMKERPIARVINSHYHFDHIKNNYLFPESEIWLNYRESPCFRDIMNIVRISGITEVFGEEAGIRWAGELESFSVTKAWPTPFKDIRWLLSSKRLDGTYKWGDTIDFGHTYAKVLPAPGHSMGCSYFFFPEERVVYTSDADFTKFGPFYGGSDSNIDEWIGSLVSLVDLEADYFITSHEAGILSLDEVINALPWYLDKIDERDRLITGRLLKGMSVEEIAREGVCYTKRALKDPHVFMWEKVMVKKHVRRLISNGMIQLGMETSSQALKDSEPLYFGAHFDLSAEGMNNVPDDDEPLPLA